jgi:4'-phosphopantetheinyl transferase
MIDHSPVNIPQNPFRFGPVVGCCWPYRRGEPAEPRVRPWLSAELRFPESLLDMVRDTHGRPHVHPQSAISEYVTKISDLNAKSAEIDINWSHSGDWLMAVYALGARVGVDLELLRPRPKALALASRFFAPEETAALARWADDPAALQLRFTRLWCAKEAVLKAHGRGLSFGLEKLRFEIDAADAACSPRLVACDPALGRPQDWALRAWLPVPGYLATVAWRDAGPAYFPA